MNSSAEGEKPGWMRRVLPRLAFYPFLAASLLIFPAALPWMILGWLALWGFQVARRKAGWPTLAFALGVLLVKRVDWAPGLVILGFLMAALAGLDFILRQEGSGRHPKLQGASGGLLFLAWTLMAWDWTWVGHLPGRGTLDISRPIGIIGDSLSSYGYSQVLAKRLRVPVIDHSRGGITAKEGLEMFPELLKSHPQAVVVELGGHDYLQGRTREETKAILEKIIAMCDEAGALVFLFEVPRGFISDPYAGLERELAREEDLELIPDGAIRRLVLQSPFMPLSSWFGPHLSDDGLHPNDKGNEFLADRVTESLRRVYGDVIVK